MAKYYSEFDKWCKRATKGIRYRPDRQEVYGELYQHIEDRYLDFLDQGTEKDEAVNMTLRVMGDADEIAPQLAAIHRPFWGYLYSFCKWGLIALAVVTVLKFVPWIVTNFQEIHEPVYKVNGYDNIYEAEYIEVVYDGQVHYIWDRLYYAEPDVKAYSDGYTFSISKVFLWNVTNELHEEQEKENYLYIFMDSTNPLPWADFSNIGEWFWAEDSLGNYYYSSKENLYSYEPAIRFCDLDRTGPFTYTYVFAIWDFAFSDTEWIELHYDRDGRDIVLRVDLTGGENP